MKTAVVCEKLKVVSRLKGRVLKHTIFNCFKTLKNFASLKQKLKLHYYEKSV